MNTTTVPDVEVDESELTQQPCALKKRSQRSAPWVGCTRPAVGEDISTCPCGHQISSPACEVHIGCRNDLTPLRGPLCITCERHGCADHRRWLIVSRLYTRAAS